jgi:hypothetical protein
VLHARLGGGELRLGALEEHRWALLQQAQPADVVDVNVRDRAAGERVPAQARRRDLVGQGVAVDQQRGVTFVVVVAAAQPGIADRVDVEAAAEQHPPVGINDRDGGGGFEEKAVEVAARDRDGLLDGLETEHEVDESEGPAVQRQQRSGRPATRSAHGMPLGRSPAGCG